MGVGRAVDTRLSLVALLGCAAIMTSSGTRTIVATATPAQRAHHEDATIGELLWPGAFVESTGDTSTRILFEASGRRYVAETRSDGFFVRHGTRDDHAIDVRFRAARSHIRADSSGPLAGTLSVFHKATDGAMARLWKRYSAVTFRDVYPGIAARYRGNDGDLELEFLLAPGADPRTIELAGAANTHFSVDVATGDIVVRRDAETFRMRRPRAFQPGPTGQIEVEVRIVAGPDTLHFELPAYDPSRPLVIDPLVASWSTFVGTNNDAMYDDSAVVATDSGGNLYVAGLTQFSTTLPSADSFPSTAQSVSPANPRAPGDNCVGQCGYVLKLTPTHQVVYGALIYGLTIKALAVDAGGSAYITGTTINGTGFPGTAGVFDNNPAGQAFLTKISADGGSLVYSALFTADAGNGVAVDSQGNAYVVGQVSVPNLPTTPGSLKPANPIGATINQDGFLLKVNPSGSALIYGTYLGGGGTDLATAVQVDSQDQAIVVGKTASGDFVGLNATVSGPSDAFLIKVAADGGSIVSGQTFGGSADDAANAIAPDGGGGWIMCGDTASPDLSTTAGALQPQLLGTRNGWLRRVDAGFGTLYSTYFGGSTIDGCLNVASDTQGNAYLVGVAFSTDMPITADAFQDTSSSIVSDFYAGLSDAFYVWGHSADRESYFAKLSGTGALVYGTYLGGYETWPRFYDPLSIGTGVTVAPSGKVTVSGATTAASFPVTDQGLRAGMGGTADGFVVTLADSPVGITTPSLLPAAALQMPYQMTLRAAGGTPPYSWAKVGFEMPDGITLSSAGVLSGAASNPQTEADGYQFTVKVTDASGRSAYKSLFLNVGWPGNFICSGDTCVAELLQNNQLAYQVPPLARGVYPQYFDIIGQVPPGISVSNTGEITGAPTETGEYHFGFHVTDASSQKSATINFHVLVFAGPGVASATLSASPSTVTAGQPFTLTWNSFYTTGCIAGGGGASGTPWSGSLPVFGSTTQTANATGSFDYTVSCPSGGATPIVAHASVTVNGSSGGSSSSGGGSSGGSSGGGGGGGAMGEWPLVALTVFVWAWRRDPRRVRSRARLVVPYSSRQSSAIKTQPPCCNPGQPAKGVH